MERGGFYLCDWRKKDKKKKKKRKNIESVRDYRRRRRLPFESSQLPARESPIHLRSNYPTFELSSESIIRLELLNYRMIEIRLTTSFIIHYRTNLLSAIMQRSYKFNLRIFTYCKWITFEKITEQKFNVFLFVSYSTKRSKKKSVSNHFSLEYYFCMLPASRRSRNRS